MTEDNAQVGSFEPELAAWPIQVSIWAGRSTVQGMVAIASWIREHWGVEYKKADLVKLAAQIAVQLIKGGLVARRGLHFTVTVPLPAGADYSLPRIEHSNRGQGLSVSGPAIADLEWLESWLWQAGSMENTRSDVLEAAVDLTLQALQAGLVEQPRGPQISTFPPAQK